MRGEIRKCPCCGVRISRGKLMCMVHWMMVPKDVRRAVNRSWQAFRQSPTGHPAIVALDVYNAALKAAIAGVMAKLASERKAA